MIKLILKVNGMMCLHCEKHAVNAVKSVVKNAKVTASHTAKTVEITAKAVDIEAVYKAIQECGYTVVSHEQTTLDKKGFLSIFNK